jgi:hypothetical protein
MSPLDARLVALVAHARDDAHAPDEESLAPSDVDPPLISVLQAGPGASRGLIFIAPKGAEAVAQGPEIVDDEGRPVWFLPLPVGAQATSFGRRGKGRGRAHGGARPAHTGVDHPAAQDRGAAEQHGASRAHPFAPMPPLARASLLRAHGDVYRAATFQ